MSEIIFEDSEIVAVWRQGVSPFLLVTFGDLVQLAAGTAFFGDNPVRKLDLTCLGVMGKTPNWFPQKSMESLLKAIAGRLTQYPTRITYGGSMGGYGAIKFSGMLSATNVISLCPQWTIDPGECDGVSPGWRTHFRPDIMKGMGIQAKDVSGQVYVLSDPYDPLDRYHFEQLRRRCPSLNEVAVPNVGHNVTPVMAGTENLRNLIDATLSNDIPSVRRVVRSARIRNRELIIRKVMKKKHRLISKIFATKATLIDQSIPFATKIVQSLFMDGQTRILKTYATKIIQGPYSLKLKKDLAVIAGISEIRLRTFFGTFVGYDNSSNSVGHMPAPSVGKLLLLIGDIEEKRIQLKLVGPDGSLPVAVGRDGELEVSAEGSFFDLCEVENGGFTLTFNDRFLSAEPNGSVICNRSHAAEWETFQAHCE